MPSVIGTDAGSGVNVAANYLKTLPSTQFGTRQLAVIKIEVAGLTDGAGSELVANSLFSKTVRALQQTAEVWSIFTPVDTTTDYFHAIISVDSQWDGDAANQGATGGLQSAIYGTSSGYNFGILETAIAAGNGGVTATVSIPTGFVAPFRG
jgi:hypothetical protein